MYLNVKIKHDFSILSILLLNRMEFHVVHENCRNEIFFTLNLHKKNPSQNVNIRIPVKMK